MVFIWSPNWKITTANFTVHSFPTSLILAAVLWRKIIGVSMQKIGFVVAGRVEEGPEDLDHKVALDYARALCALIGRI